jgi:hypothetical protein
MGVKTENVSNRTLLLGDNYFESGSMTVGAGVTVKAGTVLKREADGKFAPAENTGATPGSHGTPAAGGGWDTEPADSIPGDVPIAVVAFDITNERNAPADVGFRALIGGRARSDMLTLGGAPLTPAQRDALRACGIIPLSVKDLSRLDNQ